MSLDRSLDRPVARLMAAMILAIIAFVVPSAVWAHEGHAHHGHYDVTARPQAVPQAVPQAAKAALPAGPSARSAAPAWSEVALVPAEPAQIGPGRDDGCRSGCRTRCCGTMACCATAVLPGPPILSPSLLRTVTLIPCDVPVRAGTGPEALPEPPRTRA